MASTSGVGLGVTVGSAAATIAWTVASILGLDVGAGSSVPRMQAAVSSSAKISMPRIFMDGILARGKNG